MAGGLSGRKIKASPIRTALQQNYDVRIAATGDVADALIAYRKTREFREQQQLLVESAQDATRLSQMRYKGGAASYLEVLTNDTNYFSAELGLVQAQLDELLAFVQVYKSLGGGWEQ